MAYLTELGGRFGSSLIDIRFKRWLQRQIGKSQYASIDPESARIQKISPHTPETGPIRELMKRFNVAKAAFSN